MTLLSIAYAAGEAVATAGAVAGETTAPGTPEVPGILGQFGAFLPLILMFVALWFIMIRPQKKKEKELKNKLSKMKVGDKAVSIGGIYGKIYKIKDEFVILETGNLGTVEEKSYIKLEKSAIRDIISKNEA